MRLEYVRRQKEWEAELASQAPLMSFDPVEAEDEDDFLQMQMEGWAELPASSADAMQISASGTQQPWVEEEVDEVLLREDQELEALLSYMPAGTDAVAQADEREDQRSEHLWSDDDDYDTLFSEYMEQDAMASQQGQAQGQEALLRVASQNGEAMDMS